MSDFIGVLPVAVLALWGCILLLVDVFYFEKRTNVTAWLAAAGMALTLVLTLVVHSGQEMLVYNGMISVDGFAVFLSVLFLVSGMIAVLLSYDYLERMGINRGEYYTLMIFAITGMILMGYASDLIVTFLALELLSIPLYVLSGFARPRVSSEESAMKYFLLGAFASGFFVYGVALIFGATGTTNFAEIVDVLTARTANITLLLSGAGMLVVGLGFKVGAVPFHMWTPDVYQGAPSAVTAFMAVGAKVGGFAALLRIFVVAFGDHYELVNGMTGVFWGLAAITMIVGNILAISQKNIKRLLAYSSVSQAGYIMMALVPFGQPDVAKDTIASGLFYLLSFAITSFGVWAVVIALEKVVKDGDGMHKGLELEDYAGLGQRYPLLATAMTVFMLSFTGLPPTLGFAAKLYVFRTAIEGGFMGLAVIGVVTSLISAFYYLRIVIIMFMQDGEPEVYPQRWLSTTAVTAAVATVVLTIFASPLFSWAANSVVQLF
jgi:NADH-quinone oxidoreductase subunit N